jgi:hypothetical protein
MKPPRVSWGVLEPDYREHNRAVAEFMRQARARDPELVAAVVAKHPYRGWVSRPRLSGEGDN